MALKLSIATLADGFAHCLLSREPYRHFQMEITVTNTEDHVENEVSYEICVPVESIFNLDGDAWNPMYRHEVDGKLYDVWQTLGGFGGRYDDTIGISFRNAGKWEQKLAVNLKPYESSVDLLWRLFEKGDPLCDYGRASVALQAYAPRF